MRHGRRCSRTVRDTRDRIVDAAMELFWVKGYGSTSIADILAPRRGQQRQPLSFLPGQAGPAGRRARSLSRRHRADAARAGLGGDRRSDRADLRPARRYRALIVDTDCLYGCPIGSLALELHEPDPIVRERLAENFDAWTDAIRDCLDEAGERLPAGRRPPALAEFVLTVMEGAVMQARTHRDVAYFDRAVAQLRQYFDSLMQRRRPMIIADASPPRRWPPSAGLAAGPRAARLPGRPLLARPVRTGGEQDTHCFDAVYGGQHVRDRHEVTGGAGVYRGETLYSADGERRGQLHLLELAGRGQPRHDARRARTGSTSATRLSRRRTAARSPSRPSGAASATMPMRPSPARPTRRR